MKQQELISSIRVLLNSIRYCVTNGYSDELLLAFVEQIEKLLESEVTTKNGK